MAGITPPTVCQAICGGYRTPTIGLQDLWPVSYHPPSAVQARPSGWVAPLAPLCAGSVPPCATPGICQWQEQALTTPAHAAFNGIAPTLDPVVARTWPGSGPRTHPVLFTSGVLDLW